MPAPAPAVGEKKRFVCEGVADETGPLVVLRTPRPEVTFCDESWSVYLENGPGGAGKAALSLPRCWAMAAFSTERWSKHAMMARQSSRARAKVPITAPTQMKTVPSGRLETCM